MAKSKDKKKVNKAEKKKSSNFAIWAIVIIVSVVGLIAIYYSGSISHNLSGNAIMYNQGRSIAPRNSVVNDQWSRFYDVDSSMYIRGGTGDIDNNGEVQNNDKNDYLRQYLLGNRMLSHEEFARADINGDGKVNWDDYAIMNMIIGMGKNSPGYWTSRDNAIMKVSGLYGARSRDTFYVHGNSQISGLSGNGNAYVCVNAMGALYRSDEPCR